MLACVLRYVFHVISGCTVWAGLSIPDSQALLYSLAYNATYMVPETLVTVVGAIYLSKVLDFRSESITRTAPQAKAPDLALLWSGIGKALLAAAAVFDIQHFFFLLQNPETGDFDITGITRANWGLLAAVTGAGIVLFLLCSWLASRVPADNGTDLKGFFRSLPFIGVVAAAAFDVAFIVLTFREGAPDAEGWTQIVLVTLCVLAAAGFLVFRNRAKRQAR